MNWSGYLVAALAILIISLLLAGAKQRIKYKRGRFFEPIRIVFIGVLLTVFVLFVPIYREHLGSQGDNWLDVLFLSAHNVIRLLVVDGDIRFISETMVAAPEIIYSIYLAVFSVLYVMAPVLTFSFVLSFFKNISSYLKYYRNYNTETYVFSELNEKSICLAESINEKKGKKLFVFTDVYVKDEEQSSELIERARELGAVCLKKDILSINFWFHSKKSEMSFLTIGTDETENIDQSLKLITLYNQCENMKLYVFSTQVEAEILLSKVNNGKMKVRRINEVQSLIYRVLTETGYSIFEDAEMVGDEKYISAVLIGLGQHGTEMIKALAWFCQMDGYKVEINAFDIDKKAESKFIQQCPELMDNNHNNKFDDDGESQYKITIHSKTDVSTIEFVEHIKALNTVTYVFISLGEDEKNIKTAIKLREIFERMGIQPRIQAVVQNSEMKDVLVGITNYSGQEYKIDFVGDVKAFYSKEVIINSEIEEEALARHLKWGPEESFWKYEYNYRSSIASALHKRMKIACDIPGADLPPEQRKHSDRQALRKLEHRRWNAYMRTEGYVYAPTRNNLAKQHNCLVAFEKLSQKDQEKDDD